MDFTSAEAPAAEDGGADDGIDTGARDRDTPRGRWLVEQALPHEAFLRKWVKRRYRLPEDHLDDIIQDVFVRLLQTRDVAHIRCIRSYVWRTAWSVILTRCRQPKWLEIETISEDELAEAPCDAPLPDEIVFDRLALAHFLRRFGRLPERTRTMFLHYKIEGERVSDVADRCDLSISTVEKTCRAALHELQALCRD